MLNEPDPDVKDEDEIERSVVTGPPEEFERLSITIPVAPSPLFDNRAESFFFVSSISAFDRLDSGASALFASPPIREANLPPGIFTATEVEGPDEESSWGRLAMRAARDKGAEPSFWGEGF